MPYFHLICLKMLRRVYKHTISADEIKAALAADPDSVNDKDKLCRHCYVYTHHKKTKKWQ